MHPYEQPPLFESDTPSPEPVRIEISEPESAAEPEKLPSADNFDAYPGVEGITDAQREQIDRLVEGGQFNLAQAEEKVLGYRVGQEKAQPPTRAVNHHPGRRPQRSRRLGAMGRLTADGPPAHIAETMRLSPFPPIDSEAAQKARQIVDGDTSNAPGSEIV